jgi:hypothetical protein
MDSADFPESDLVRSDRGTVERRAGDTVRSVHYPDRDRAALADRPRPIAPGDPDVLPDRPADLPVAERRQGERRRIDRLSTDI